MSQHIKIRSFIYESRFPGSLEKLEGLATLGLSPWMTIINGTWWSSVRLATDHTISWGCLSQSLHFSCHSEFKIYLSTSIYVMYLYYSSVTIECDICQKLIFLPPTSPNLYCLLGSCRYPSGSPQSWKQPAVKLGCTRSLQPLDGVYLAHLNLASCSYSSLFW